MIKFELPDYEEFNKWIGEIAILSLKEANLKLTIQENEAKIVRDVTNNPEYFINKKPPSQEYIKNTYKITGYDGELIPLRKELAKVSTELDKAKREYEILRIVTDIWRTQSANERL